jgi:hypothetical protein
MFSKKSMNKPDETRKFPKGSMKIAKIGDRSVGLGSYAPGWRWSKDLKPIAKTDRCMAHHVGYAISGRMSGVMEDGMKWSVKKGDLLDLPPGHDAWVVGKEKFVFIDMNIAPSYAK